jgi:uncharacterized protein (DUF2384 family)
VKLSSSNLRKAAEIQQRIERLQAELDTILASSDHVRTVRTVGRLSRAFGVSERALDRRNITALTRLYRKGLAVLGDGQSVREWFMTANPSLGGRKPSDLTETGSGCLEVERLLGRIEYGVF